jgi:hypothetical protein
MVSNTTEYMNRYMRKYVANACTETCQTCGKQYKSYHKYRHIVSKKHVKAVEGREKMDEVHQLRQRVTQLERMIAITA